MPTRARYSGRASLPARHRVRFYVRGVSGGNRPRTSRSLLAQTVLVLPRTMVYDHGIQQEQRVEGDDHRDCNGEICPNAHGKHFNETRSFPKTNAITRLLALSSPHKLLLSRASTELGRKSAGEGPPGGEDAAPPAPYPLVTGGKARLENGRLHGWRGRVSRHSTRWRRRGTCGCGLSHSWTPSPGE
jgi:hypothetical protein